MSKKPPLRNRITSYGMVDPATLTPNPQNWRTHPTAQQAALKGILKEVGWVGVVTINKTTGHLVDGHLRREAALKQKENSIPAIYVELTEDEERLVLATLDPIGALAERDDAILKDLVSQVQTQDEGLQALLDELGASEEPPPPADGLRPGTDPDAVPDPPKVPTTRLGELWVLGSHRLLCGDSTSMDDVQVLMGGGLADMVFTDPPYGVNFQSGMSKGGTATRFDPLLNDDKILDIAPVIWSVMGEDTAAFIWTSHHVLPRWRAQFAKYYKQTIIWYKHGGGIGDLTGGYALDYEMALFCTKGHPTFRRDRGMAVWDIQKDSANTYLHPTQKPVALAERAILDFTDPRGVILDLFGGSGSTLIACEQTGRSGRLMELDPIYCDVIVRRWEEATGRQAERHNGSER
jgi:DNA modification methylase